MRRQVEIDRAHRRELVVDRDELAHAVDLGREARARRDRAGRDRLRLGELHADAQLREVARRHDVRAEELRRQHVIRHVLDEAVALEAVELDLPAGALARPRDLGLAERVARDLAARPTRASAARARRGPARSRRCARPCRHRRAPSSVTSPTPESTISSSRTPLRVGSWSAGHEPPAPRRRSCPGWSFASPRGGSIVGPEEVASSRRAQSCTPTSATTARTRQRRCLASSADSTAARRPGSSARGASRPPCRYA